MKSRITYKGLFISEKEDIDKLRNLSEELEEKIIKLHVTFEISPKTLFPKDLLGKEFMLKVIGIGKDLKNHGVLVEIPNELKKYYKGAKNPHITISKSLDGSAKDTANLIFQPIESFYIKGRLGYHTYNGVFFEK